MDDCSRDNSVSIEPTNQCRSRQINKESQDQRLDSTNKTVPVQRTTWKGSKKFRTLRDRRCLAAIKGIGMLLRCLSRLSHSHYTEQTFLVTFLQKIIHKKNRRATYVRHTWMEFELVHMPPINGDRCSSFVSNNNPLRRTLTMKENNKFRYVL